MHKPSELTHVEAAAVTMASCVAWGGIGYAKVKSGDRCLIVGASGAIKNAVLKLVTHREKGRTIIDFAAVG